MPMLGCMRGSAVPATSCGIEVGQGVFQNRDGCAIADRIDEVIHLLGAEHRRLNRQQHVVVALERLREIDGRDRPRRIACAVR